MPRVEASPRRAKRGTQHPVPQKLARTAASVRAEAMANASSGGSVSAPPIVKREPVALTVPPPPSTSANKAASVSPQRAWRHPDELQYIRSGGKTWNDIAIVRFLVANAFGIPARSTSSSDPWVNVRCADGTDVVLPRGYRFPLLWVAKYLWTSVKLVLTAQAPIRQREWDSTKFEILHIARLCAGLLDSARKEMDPSVGAGVMERGWRCAQFDRALHRYWHDWLISRDEFVRDFFREFGEDEYKVDVLKFTWSRWVRKSHKGFALTKEESANGISVAEFMRGFVLHSNGTFEWREDEAAADPPQIQEEAADVNLPAFSDSTAVVPDLPPYTRIDVQVPQFQRKPPPEPSRLSFRVRRTPRFSTSEAQHAGVDADAAAHGPNPNSTASPNNNVSMKMKGGRRAPTTATAGSLSSAEASSSADVSMPPADVPMTSFERATQNLMKAIQRGPLDIPGQISALDDILRAHRGAGEDSAVDDVSMTSLERVTGDLMNLIGQNRLDTRGEMKDIDQGPPDIQSQIDALGEELMALRRETATAADDMLEGARQSPLDIQSQLKALNDEVTALERSMDALRGPPGNDPMRTLVEKVRTAFGRPMEQLPRWRDSGSQRAEGHTRTLKAVEQDTAEDDDEAEMQVDTSQLEHEEREDTPQLEHEEQEEQEQEQETSGDVGAGVLTRMGSQRPVSRSNAVVRGGSVPVPELEPAAGNGRREEEEDEEMPLHALQEHQNPAPIMTSEIEGGNPELDNDEEEEEEEEAEDLELLYPDPDPNHQGDGPSAISQPAANGTLSAAIRASTSGSNSPSPSRSVSPVPPLSTARFPAPAPDDPRATQLTAQPPRTVSPLPAPPVISAPISTSTSADADAESAMVAKFLQSCERLGEDMRALRAEVAQLRAGVRDAPQTPITELEARVRRLEEERPLLQRVHPAGYEGADTRAGRAETGKRWSHPLQHLLRLDSEMEMDVDDEGEGNGAVMAPNYRPPLPPRSRKFDNAARV